MVFIVVSNFFFHSSLSNTPPSFSNIAIIAVVQDLDPQESEPILQKEIKKKKRGKKKRRQEVK